MYRVMQRQEVVYGRFQEFLESVEELNAILRDRGWTEFRVWAPSFGKNNEVILEAEYPDLASYERETTSVYADSEVMEKYRKGSSLIVQGSAFGELLEPIPEMA